MTDTPETNFVEDYEPGPQARVELKNGRLVDVVNGVYLDPNVSMVLENGKIAAMPGSSGEESEVEADYSIDLQGKTVIPSLFNTHCHMVMASPTMVPGFKDLRLSKKHAERQKAKTMAECLAHGITTIRDAYTEDQRTRNAVVDRIAAGEIPGPRIQRAVLVGPPGSYLAEKYGFGMKMMRSAIGLPTLDHFHPASGIMEFPVDANEQQVRDAVDRAIDERGAETIKIGEQLENMTTFKPDSVIMKIEQMEALADQARKRGLQTTIHHVSVATFRRAVKAGVSSLAHIASDDLLTQEDIEAFLAAGTIIEPTLSVAYDLCWKIEGDPWRDQKGMNILTEFREKTYSFEDLGKDFYIPELQDSLQRAMSKLSSGKIKMLGFIDLSQMFQYYSKMVSHGFENFSNLYKNGAVMALGNDGGVAPCTPAMMGPELRFFDLILDEYAGIGRLKGIDALRIGTINSAKSLGLDADFGTIETGKTADLVVLDGDPLEDVGLVGGRAAALFKDGVLAIDNCGLEIGKKG
ncbi:MAG: amidohydrolase family protein [Proteobacteria bacterium]|nr:amidohydrolase family protein [Pseudomonadota bacterium]